MNKFIPGKVVHTFVSKTGQEVIVRYPKQEDLPQLTRYINELSSEDTFVSWSGEEITSEEEAKFLSDSLRAIEQGDKTLLEAFAAARLIGVCGVERNTDDKKRGLHVGIFGISVAKRARGNGIGYELATVTIREATETMHDLRLITLTCFDSNVGAKALYKKIGFKITGTVPGGFLYKGKFENKLYMMKELIQVPR